MSAWKKPSTLLRRPFLKIVKLLLKFVANAAKFIGDSSVTGKVVAGMADECIGKDTCYGHVMDGMRPDRSSEEMPREDRELPDSDTPRFGPTDRAPDTLPPTIVVTRRSEVPT
jgi:hypothetical protein